MSSDEDTESEFEEQSQEDDDDGTESMALMKPEQSKKKQKENLPPPRRDLPGLACLRPTVSSLRAEGANKYEKTVMEREARSDWKANKANMAPSLDLADNFRTLLRHRHRTCTCGWRVALDKNQAHFVSKNEFFQGLRQLGFSQDAKSVWDELGGNTKDTIILADIDMKASLALRHFYFAYRDRLGKISTLTARSDSNQINKDTFMDACKGLKDVQVEGQKLDLAGAFKALQSVKGVITADDCNWLEHYCERKTHQPPSAQNQPDSPADQASKADKKKTGPQKRKAKARLKILEKFRSLLRHKYGTVVRAWHAVLDPQARGELQFEDLKAFCYGNGFSEEEMDLLWQQLTGGEHYIHEPRLEDLEPGAEEALNEFKRGCEHRFRHMAIAFKTLVAKKKPLVSEEELYKWCKELKAPANPRLLIQYLDPEEKGYILLDAIDDVAAFEVCGEEALSIAKEQLAAMEPKPPRKEHSSLLAQPEYDGTPRKEEKHTELRKLLETLERKYGSTVRAWMAVLDPKGRGKLTKKEFFIGCAAAGFIGNPKLVWEELGKKTDTATVKFKDLEPDAAEDLRNFKQLATDKFGTLHDALEKFNSSKSKQNPKVALPEFSKLCNKLKVSSSADRLFSLLDVPGRNLISAKSIDWLNETKEASEDKMYANLLQNTKAEKSKKWKAKLEAQLPPEMAKSVKEQDIKIRVGKEKREKRKDLEEQRTTLLKTLSSPDFGGVTRGWKLALDPEEEEALDYGAFSTGLQRLKLLEANPTDEAHERAEVLFKALDKQDTGTITLAELDDNATYGALAELKLKSQIRFGSCQAAFEQYDPQGTGEITVDQFRHLCHEVRCPDKVHRLLQFVDPNEEGVIKLEVIDKDAAEKAKETVLKIMHIRKMNRRLREKQRGAHMYTELPRIGVLAGPEARDQQRALGSGGQVLGTLRQRWCRKFGNMPQAWRKQLNPRGETFVNFNMFEEASKKAGVESADAKKAWSALTEAESPDGLKRANITLPQLDPGIKEDLKRFIAGLKECYGSVDLAFDAVDANDSFELNYKGFRILCATINYKGNPRRLFDYLDSTGESIAKLSIIDPQAVERVRDKRTKEEEEDKKFKEGVQQRLEASRQRVKNGQAGMEFRQEELHPILIDCD
mmetsp:Transcript_63268/g.119768  ORF Transcript_63268/g.119768 Transcript_63268/m.119768 type:complete len:1137 (+) Transcript_63268:82-3492(+)